MQVLKLTGGHQPRISGKPAAGLTSLGRPTHVAEAPLAIHLMKPRLLVKAGDTVRLGQPIVQDKKNPVIILAAPGGGTIVDIRFGPRRVIEHIAIDLAEDEDPVRHPTYSEADIESLPRDEIVSVLTTAGLWPLLMALPFRAVADPETIPPAIWVWTEDMEPFGPDPAIYLADAPDAFDLGVKILKRLTDKVIVALHRRHQGLHGQMNGNQFVQFSGRYPAGDPGVLVYHTKKTTAENVSWYIHAQDVVRVAQLFRTGRYPVEKIVAVGGDAATASGHFKTRVGVAVSHLLANRFTDPELRHIAGGIFNGRRVAPDSYLGLREAALTVVSEGNTREFMALLNPGWKKPTYSNVYLSRLNSGEQQFDCTLHGGERACVACMYCADVCPVRILPHLTYKAVLAEEVEEFLAHGLLDCVECGLCSYVCPSKIELAKTVMAAKVAYLNERKPS